MADDRGHFVKPVVLVALCAAAAIPGLLLLWVLIKRSDFDAIEARERAATATA